MGFIKKLFLLALLAAAVILFGMARYGWRVYGYSWDDVSSHTLMPKNALEQKRSEYFKKAVESSKDRD